jgi:hypothetical protein
MPSERFERKMGAEPLFMAQNSSVVEEEGNRIGET